MDKTSRRQFLRKVTAATFASLGLAESTSAADLTPAELEGSDLPDEATILFQGNSITDGGRDRGVTGPNSQSGLGGGYVLFAAAELLEAHPEKDLQCYNRGISGNKVFQLADRWDRDCLDLAPDVLSILIGVNDYWHTLSGSYEGTPEVYADDFRSLLDRTLEALPDVDLIIGEPFVLPEGSAVTKKWLPAFKPYQQAARTIAGDYEAAFIPYQAVFEEASRSVPQTYWSDDGVHPSTAGCRLMANAWLETFRSM
jgi:lysophospholipase L1-like esterase